MNDYPSIFNLRGHLYNEAVNRQAAARMRERAVLLDLLRPRAGETILDAPAGGGYVADGLRAMLGDDIRIICAEPSERFAAAINRAFTVLISPLEATPLPDASVDAVASLVGLHHFMDKRPIYREWARLVKSGGRIVIADVEAGTPTARFLNDYVHRHTPGGHEGIFLAPGELTRELESAGFRDIEESLVSVPWSFSNDVAMAEFSHTLFSLSLTTPAALAADLPRWLGVQRANEGVLMDWSLRYAVARR